MLFTPGRYIENCDRGEKIYFCIGVQFMDRRSKELDINSPLSQYLNAYFGVQPGDDEALRYKLHDM